MVESCGVIGCDLYFDRMPQAAAWEQSGEWRGQTPVDQ